MESPKKYKVIISQKASKQLNKLDRQTFNIITTWIKKNLVDCENPKQNGKPLIGNKAGYWRYRVGAYRIIAEIYNDELIIQIIEIGHRREIYN